MCVTTATEDASQRDKNRGVSGLAANSFALSGTTEEKKKTVTAVMVVVMASLTGSGCAAER